MRFKRAIHNVLSTLGYGVTRRLDGSYEIERLLRFGADPIADVRQILGRPVGCVFDVGANVGHTALKYSAAFPGAAIYTFEPDREVFRQLQSAVRHLPHVHPVNAALGRAHGEATLFRSKFSETNSLRVKAAGAEQYVLDRASFDPVGSEVVDVMTVDDFCAAHHIDRIDLLKLDTQGHEIEVLAGAARMLSATSVPLIYAEVSFVPLYESQPLFPEVYQYLHVRGYRFVDLYESGFLTHYYQISGNALFVHESLGPRVKPAPRFRFGRVVIH
jgi:FkbM family methyltransferase